MKKTKVFNKLTALLLTFVMVLSLVPAMALTASAAPSAIKLTGVPDKWTEANDKYWDDGNFVEPYHEYFYSSFTQDELPGFLPCTEAEANEWSAPTDEFTVLIFALNDGVCSYRMINSGKKDGIYADALRRCDIFNWFTNGRNIYYTGAAAVTEYPLWVGGTQVTSANAANITGAETATASYAADTNTLTLNGYTNSGTARADIQSGVNNAAIYYDDNMFSPNPLTIQLAEGTTNSLTMTGDRVYGIYVFGSALTITGNGTLNVQSDSMAINDAWGVAITGGTVNAASSAYYGIGSVTIGADISSVTITGELGAIYVEEQELINAVAGTGWTDTAGTMGKATIAVSTEGQTISSSYKKVQFPAALEPVTYLDANGDVQSCTDYTVVTENTTAWVSGWYVVNSDVTSVDRISVHGDVKLILCDGKTLTNHNYINCWYDEGDRLTIYVQSTGNEMGSLIVDNSTTNTSFDAIDVLSITIYGGNITAKGNSGIDADELTISGGTITAVALGEYSQGIRADLTTVTGGKVSATGQFGINGPITISGGEVYAEGTVYGLYIFSGGGAKAPAAGDISINGGSVTAIGEIAAISGTVKNAIAGTGWTDKAGTTGEATIAVSTEGQELDSYKKVQFPAAVPTHTHNYATAWTSDATNHWHACTADGDCTAPKSGEAAHTYGSDVNATAYYTCSVCGYENATRKAEYKAHQKPAHTHNYSTEWTSDETNHWHVCTADGTCTAPKKDEGAHAYGSDISATAYYTCSACGYEDSARKADYDAVNGAKAKIAAIGTVEYTEACRNKIVVARTAYNALTAAQKALVDESALLAAESEYEKLEQEGKEKLEEGNVTVTIQDGSVLIPVDIELKVELKTEVKSESSSEDYSEEAAKLLADNEEIFAVYDVKLVRIINGVEKEIQPSDIKEGTVILVTMEIPAELKGKDFKVMHIHSADDIEYVEYTVENGEIRIQVDRLSQFAFVSEKAETTSKGSAVGIVIASVAVVLLVIFFLLLFFLLKKRKKEDKEDKKKENATK